MNISVDDLTSSFSSSNIGQEAQDLAILQAQLAQALFCQSMPHSSNTQHVSRRTSFSQPCNTPTFSSFPATIPFPNNSPEDTNTSSGTAWMLDPSTFSSEGFKENLEGDDEPMGEDMLISRSPASTHSFTLQSPQQRPHGSQGHITPSSQSPEFSSFPSTDPFYIAQLQAQYHNSASLSTFAQLGQLPQNSPFSSSHRRTTTGANHSTLPHNHSFLVATTATFDL